MPISGPSMPSVPDGFHVDNLALHKAFLLIIARTTAAKAASPACRRPSARLHTFSTRRTRERVVGSSRACTSPNERPSTSKDGCRSAASLAYDGNLRVSSRSHL